MTPLRQRRRYAFTLIELMVVILIIVILVSLISSAAMMALGKLPQVQTSTDIAQMSLGLQHFMMDYNLSDPPPSYLVLYENLALYNIPPYSTVPGAAQSYAFLQKAFGNNLGSPINPLLGFPWVDWNGDSTPNGPLGLDTPVSGSPWVLEGEQCLVFYLGGIPSAPGLAGFAPQGFSTYNMNPSTTGGRRNGPYFSFQTPRLVAVQAVNPLAAGSPGFPVYIDGYQSKSAFKPYAYFSSNGINNGYSQLDCASLVAFPYQKVQPSLFLPSGQYFNSNTFQIISAGKDGVFGTLTIPATTYAGISPTSGAAPVVPLVLGAAVSNANAARQPAAADDQSNFSSTLLGIGQN